MKTDLVWDDNEDKVHRIHDMRFLGDTETVDTICGKTVEEFHAVSSNHELRICPVCSVGDSTNPSEWRDKFSGETIEDAKSRLDRAPEFFCNKITRDKSETFLVIWALWEESDLSVLEAKKKSGASPQDLLKTSKHWNDLVE